jgi:hypothetical protein
MSLFDSASLILTPNAYKEDKLYSIKPTDGSGDLVVTRATTATRVNSAGLVELVPYNLLQYSQDLTNAAWSLIGTITRTSNYGTAPDGTQTSTRIQWGGAANFELYQYTGKSADVLGSIYIKGTLGQIVRFNNSNITLTGSWQEVSNSLLVDGSNTYMSIRGIVGTTTALDFQVWGAQAVQGTSAKEYFPTTDRLNVPRIDYTNGSCPSILVEPQRTNSALYSEQFDNGYWSKFNTTITANAIVAPNGTTTADKFVENTATNFHSMDSTFTSGTGIYSASVYAKIGERRYLRLNITEITPAKDHTALFDLQTGTLLSSGTGVTANITSVGNGWYRISVTSPALVGGQVRMALLMQTTTSSTPQSYTGDGTSGLYIWGAQLELGSYPTSYIPTVASAVTRNADVISKIGISSLIGQTEGTIFLDFYYTGLADNHMIINDSSFTSYIYFNSQNANQIWAQIQNIGIQFSMSATAGRYKCALAYKSGNSAFYANGTQIGTSATAFSLSGNIATLDYTISTPKNNINASALWKTRLDNATLAQLTTI